MNILLVRPKPPVNTVGLKYVMVCEPLELEYMGASVTADHDVIIIDMILEKRPLEYFIKQHKPDIVGFTGYITHVNQIKSYAKQTKQINPECRVVVGGVHAEVLSGDFDSGSIDYIITSNAHQNFPELVQAIASGAEPAKVPGVRSKGQSASPEAKPSYPEYLPDRELTKRYRDKYYYMFHNPCALIKTSYGCPYSCNFCFCIQVTDETYFTRPLDSVIEELQTIEEPEIYIVDDNFLVSRERVLEFCDKLETNNIHKHFLIYGRADFIAANPDVIERFKACGLRAVIVGIESWDQSELDDYGKKSDILISENAIQILDDNKVDCYGTFILAPQWSAQDFDQMYQWIRSMGLIFVNLQPLTPLPGTPIYAQYEDKLLIPRDRCEQWDFAHLVLKPEQLSPAAYYWNIMKLYYKITMHYSSIIKMFRRYGVLQTLKLSRGASIVTLQYLVKIFSSFFDSKFRVTKDHSTSKEGMHQDEEKI